MGAELGRGHLDLLLLGVLRHGPRHGYAVINELRDRTEGTFDLPEGTVYPALHRLQDDGLLVSYWEDVSGRRRRLYRLTPPGQAALASEKQRWRTFAQAVDAVLGSGAGALGAVGGAGAFGGVA